MRRGTNLQTRLWLRGKVDVRGVTVKLMGLCVSQWDSTGHRSKAAESVH